MAFSRDELISAMIEWNRAWDRHDLDRVMDLFHEEIHFENWTGGKAQGKEALRKAWSPWFADHGHFRFKKEDLFADEQEQWFLHAWKMTRPFREKGFEGKPEKRRCVDGIYFKDGKIIIKLIFSQARIKISGETIAYGLELPAENRIFPK